MKTGNGLFSTQKNTEKNETHLTSRTILMNVEPKNYRALIYFFSIEIEKDEV